MRRSRKTYQTEPFLRKIHASMVRDLEPVKTGWFSDPRTYTGPRYDNWAPYKFKVMYQLEHMFKRVLLSTDPSFEDLAVASFEKFTNSQSEFGVPEPTQRSCMLFERARDICHDILGEFDHNEFFELCSFGKRAASELPFRESYLDRRVNTLNGSQSQIEWFKAALCQDIHLHRACRQGLKKAKVVKSLELKAVPKSYKAARIIAPDTTLGGFLSKGLGNYMRKQLETRTHINLKTQQARHRDLAKRGSVDGYVATIDMQRASDSFVWEHVWLLVPSSWWDVLETCRTPAYEVGGKLCELRSFMLMGSGHTFPLQTILFYSLVKAVLELMGSKARVDVYGDDIIFPSEYQYYVIQSLYDAGFTVNVDKSYVEGPFRESCGGDYHTGIDVRPFNPEHVCGTYSAYEYTECLHKWLNGLLLRWSYEEIPDTCDLIYNEILSIWGNLCPIPRTDPDTMGLKFIPSKYESVVRKPACANGLITYLRLVRRPKRRKPFEQRPYYWNWLHTHRRQYVRLQAVQYWSSDQLDDLYGGGTEVLDSLGREPKKGSSSVRWVSST